MTGSDPLLEIAGRYADGGASADDVRALEDALRSDPESRGRFLRYMNVDSMLGGAVGAVGVRTAAGRVESDVNAFVDQSRVRRFAGRWIGVAAVLLIAGSIGMLVWRHRTGSAVPPNAQLVTPVPPVALISATSGARWADPNVELALNSGEMPAGILRLSAGRVEFLLTDGATVVTQGPAAFRFTGPKRIEVVEGQVVCSCPTPESRVTVATAQTEIVDLGTVFSVEARADESTRVAVLSGEVEVKGARPQRLRMGDAVEVRRSEVVRLAPMSSAEMSRLAGTWSLDAGADPKSPNRLLDPGFSQGIASNVWHGTDECLEAVAAGGRSGGAVRVRAQSHRFWPLVKQDVSTGDISGKLVAASVWGSTPAEDPLRERQYAMLKLAFVDAEGREFACATRHFLKAGATSGRFEQVTVATKAPAGTFGVQVQLILNAAGLKTGSILFDDASLVIGDAPASPQTQPD